MTATAAASTPSTPGHWCVERRVSSATSTARPPNPRPRAHVPCSMAQTHAIGTSTQRGRPSTSVRSHSSTATAASASPATCGRSAQRGSRGGGHHDDHSGGAGGGHRSPGGRVDGAHENQQCDQPEDSQADQPRGVDGQGTHDLGEPLGRDVGPVRQHDERVRQRAEPLPGAQLAADPQVQPHVDVDFAAKAQQDDGQRGEREREDPVVCERTVERPTVGGSTARPPVRVAQIGWGARLRSIPWRCTQPHAPRWAERTIPERHSDAGGRPAWAMCAGPDLPQTGSCSTTPRLPETNTRKVPPT